ncbi:FliM/FliN family flagellar motor C-terminal domain-containing protein [Photobacterium sp. DA100]|uniref:FliM/FliN family flagellar motor C-terminal domain-containing protein n=1 Tax=Photobacterium sp. DA100 TaxID=3027472 RepID=UPI00247943BE|nr:FliM/FliN family flagellar motor C-terminal domain-containing protein [Photobacterium sp. DA100]WEM42981.1 FliM/FliN family flagellar motor C-terminal domain-containing protein [Photobacterium sp. DA100]
MTRRTDCHVKLLSYGLDVSYQEIKDREPICFTHNQFDGQCLISISQPLTHLIAEAFYGGTPDFSHQGKAEATDIADGKTEAAAENQAAGEEPEASANTVFKAPPMNASEKRVQARLAATLLNQISHQWQVSSEQVKFSNGVLHAKFAIQIEDSHGEIHLHLDDDLLLQLTAQDVVSQTEPAKVESLREMHLKQVPLRLSAVLSRQTLTLDQVINLNVGDIISTEIQEVVDVHAGTLPLYQAHIVERNGHLVLQVIDNITPQERN